MSDLMHVTFYQPYPADPNADASLETASVAAYRGARGEDPRGYVADPGLIDAINASLLLGQPLLLTGAPGVGKTSVGRNVAERFGLPLLEFTAKSTSRAVDLFYEYDAVGRFQAAEADRAEAMRLVQTVGQAPSVTGAPTPGSAVEDARSRMLRYIKVRALGRAILNASTPEDAKLLLPDGEVDRHRPFGGRYDRPVLGEAGRWRDHVWEVPTRPAHGDGTPDYRMQSVVIIDEIDKAPADFCNDLLDELESMRFQVPELSMYTDKGDAPRFGGDLEPSLRPIVFITSNQERPLPDAFLRRCCYYDIDLPKDDHLKTIVNQRLSDQAGIAAEHRDRLIGWFMDIREMPLAKKPGLAELLNWIRYLAFESGGALEGVISNAALLEKSLVALIKDPGDRVKVIGRIIQN